MQLESAFSAENPLDAPAFHLNFDPALLLSDPGGPDGDFEGWLQSELAECAPTPSAAPASPAPEQPQDAGVGWQPQLQPQAPLQKQEPQEQQQEQPEQQPQAAAAAPGMFELFQLHNLVPAQFALPPWGTAAAMFGQQQQLQPQQAALLPQQPYLLQYGQQAGVMLPPALDQHSALLLQHGGALLPAGYTPLPPGAPSAAAAYWHPLGAAAAQQQQQQQQDAQGAGRARGGRQAAAAAAALGAEKPKGPSRRFRERQKETISNLEAEVTEKLAQLKSLSAENDLLKLRAAVLEATVRGREYHMKVIQEHGPPVFDKAEAARDLMLGPGPERSGSLGGCSTPGSGASERDGGCGGSEEGAAAAGGGGPPGAPRAAAPEEHKAAIRELKHMSGPEILHHWKHFLQDVSGELLAAEQEEQQRTLRQLQRGERPTAEAVPAGEGACCGAGHSGAAEAVAPTCRWCSGCSSGSSEASTHTAGGCPAGDAPAAGAAAPPRARPAAPAGAAACAGVGPVGAAAGAEARIAALVEKYSYMTKFVALLNPGVLYQLFGTNLDTGLPAPYTDDHWRQVVSRLGLTRHQVTVILACAELYFSSLSRLLEERRALQQQLRLADEGLSECQRRLVGEDGGINQLQVLDKIASNLKREHVLRIMLNCFVWGRSLNSLQFAKTAVYSHPFFPDVHAMCSVLYEDARAMANGQPALVFPHRQQQQQQQQQHEEHEQLQQLSALHERLQVESDGLRSEAALGAPAPTALHAAV